MDYYFNFMSNKPKYEASRDVTMEIVTINFT